jgi:hypothetical protein
VVCRLRCRIGGEWLTKVDVGGPSEQPDGGERVTPMGRYASLGGYRVLAYAEGAYAVSVRRPASVWDLTDQSIPGQVERAPCAALDMRQPHRGL